MAIRQTFPHTEINIRDDSPRPIPVVTEMPLHIPIFFGFAEKGEPNVPHFGTMAQQVEKFGQLTFTARSPFFLHPNLFATYAGRYQAFFFVRLQPTDAAVGALVLEAAVVDDDLVQYQKDVLGARLKDEAGDWLPELEADNTTPVTEPGIKVTWAVRPLGAEEAYNTLLPTTATVGGKSVTTYPILATRGKSANAALNKVGYKLYYTDEIDTTLVDRLDALTFRFAPVQLTPGTAIETALRDVFSMPYVDVALKRDALDANTDSLYDVEEVLRRNYWYTDAAGNRAASLPFDLHVYDANVATIGTRVKAKSPEFDADLSAYRVNILSGIDAAGHEYDHLLVTNAAAVVNENVVLYHQGGADGTLTKAKLEELTVAYFSGDVYPEIKDHAQYPITHIYDSGYALATKYELLNAWSPGGLNRDDVKIVFSTQDVADAANTKQEDLSTAAALRARILLHPESLLFGTQTMRASIFQQAGYLADATSYRPLVPATLDSLVKRCVCHGAPYIKDTWKGRPNSELTTLVGLNWTPASDDHKQLSWDTGANYAQYADMRVLFYADTRSIHPIENSLLSDDETVDKLVYLKHLARRQWTIWAGRSDDVKLLFDRIATGIDQAANFAFNGTLPTATRVFQTELDAALGYQTTVEINATANMANRVWKVIVPVNRKEG